MCKSKCFYKQTNGYYVTHKMFVRITKHDFVIFTESRNRRNRRMEYRVVMSVLRSRLKLHIDESYPKVSAIIRVGNISILQKRKCIYI